MNFSISPLQTESKAIQKICMQHEHKLSVGERELLIMLHWKTLINLSMVGKRWHKGLNHLVKYGKAEIEKFVDLKPLTVFRRCVSPIFCRDSSLEIASQIVTSFYEPIQLKY